VRSVERGGRARHLRHSAEGALCDDGNVCTVLDKCMSGLCKGAVAPDGMLCTDGNVCTTSDACRMGVCVGDPSPDKHALHRRRSLHPGRHVPGGPLRPRPTPLLCDDGRLVHRRPVSPGWAASSRRSAIAARSTAPSTDAGTTAATAPSTDSRDDRRGRTPIDAGGGGGGGQDASVDVGTGAGGSGGGGAGGAGGGGAVGPDAGVDGSPIVDGDGGGGPPDLRARGGACACETAPAPGAVAGR